MEALWVIVKEKSFSNVSKKVVVGKASLHNFEKEEALESHDNDECGCKLCETIRKKK